MSQPRTHFAAAYSGPLLIGVCGYAASGQARLTSDACAVTCRACRKRMGRAALESPAARAALETFVPGESYEVHRQQWDERGPEVVRRSIAGDDAPRPDGWPSLDAALRAWVRVCSASLVASSSSYGSGGGRTDHEPAAMSRVASVVPVERAIELACADGRVFAGDAEGRGCLMLSSVDVRFVIELCIAGRGEADASGRLASRLRLNDSDVTERQVSIIWREARRSMQAYLAARKLIPRVRAHETRSSQEDDTMAHLPGYELEGIKAIAAHMGVSEATVKRIIRRSPDQNPLRVADYMGGVYASRADVEAWRAREARVRAA